MQLQNLFMQGGEDFQIVSNTACAGFKGISVSSVFCNQQRREAMFTILLKMGISVALKF